MTTSKIPEKAVEAAARAAYAERLKDIDVDLRINGSAPIAHPAFEDLDQFHADLFRKEVRPHLEAATPFILAEGYRMMANGLESDVPKNAPWSGAPTPAPEALRVAAKVLGGGS